MAFAPGGLGIWLGIFGGGGGGGLVGAALGADVGPSGRGARALPAEPDTGLSTKYTHVCIGILEGCLNGLVAAAVPSFRTVL